MTAGIHVKIFQWDVSGPGSVLPQPQNTQCHIYKLCTAELLATMTQLKGSSKIRKIPSVSTQSHDDEKSAEVPWSAKHFYSSNAKSCCSVYKMPPCSLGGIISRGRIPN